MAQNLAGQRKKLIGMPSLIALLTQKRRQKTQETKPIVISYILRIVLLTSAFLPNVTFSFKCLILLTGVPGHTL